MGYESVSGEGRIQACFSASLDNIERLCKEVKQMTACQELAEHNFVIQLLLREALNNAVLHGCKGNPEKVVTAMITIGGAGMIIDVTDDGDGFDWHRSMNADQDTAADSGRGLTIMRCNASEMSFVGVGNRIVLKKNFS